MGTLNNPSAILYGENAKVAGSGVGALNDGTYNRLLVSTAPTAGVAVSQPAVGSGPGAKTIFSWLSTTGGGASNNSMLVNGATTPQVFYFSPKVATLNVYYIRLIMCAGAFALSGSSFGGAGTGGLLGSNNPGALAKGLQISCISNGVTTALYNLLVNEDVFALNGNGRTYDSGAGIALIGELFLNQQLVVNTTDQVAVTVNDNLTGRNLTSLRACFCGVRP